MLTDKSGSTYWYHPESDAYWIHNPELEGPIDPDIGDGMSHEISLDQYVQAQIRRIDADPEHKLPDGVYGIIRRAYWMGPNISGELHYNGNFPKGFMINTSEIQVVEPGGIYTLKSGRKYLVEMIDPAVGKIGAVDG